MIKRLVGDKLNLKLNVEDKNESLYVRAFLYDISGVALSPAFVNLAHQNKGIYSENTAVMPDVAQVVAVFRAYTDNTYTTEVPGYNQAMELYEKDTLNPKDFIPRPCAVYARIIRGQIKAVVKCD